jgi:hypothetical protein
MSLSGLKGGGEIEENTIHRGKNRTTRKTLQNETNTKRLRRNIEN